jgi:ketosteroid isomerase-like protein
MTVAAGLLLLAAANRQGTGAAPVSAAAPPAGAPQTRSARAGAEIGDLFATYLRLHAAKDMEGWRRLFLPEVVCVRTGSDGVVSKYPITELAAGIAEDAKTLEEQHETFEHVRLEAHGDAASYSATYLLFHDNRKIQQGRAFFSLVRVDGAWKIASLVWYKD